MILSQYTAAVYRYRLDNSTDEEGDWYWVVRGKISDVPSGNPEDFKYPPKDE